ncbi:phospholipase D-like domain-containing protein [Pseudomonas sp. ML96]|uniref:phospholipase D-like domain-containing protein n=1 Tax=Pseudomonas sp. ML96 TaxID=1523503 RepID=UPI0005B7783E|nr:phospholipase D-like domain-containing protein [Pseudomonas sp. ML96]
MAINNAYNGVRAKEVNQINTQDGKALAAFSAPDFFIKDDNPFAPKRAGNQIHFFTTGDAYFRNVAGAIDQATQSIFITGWQINYDILLDGKRTLWGCLHQALKAKPALKVYVMPWLSPSGALGTYDFETMLAIFQLNAGLQGGPRAFCTPAIQQSGMRGLGVAFSHHQKSVVIDNRIGYVGGIDLAYGRRDDNNFSLDASKRQGNDAYNPGLPKFGWMELEEHVSSMGLMLATLFDLSRPMASASVKSETLGIDWDIPLSPSRAQTMNGGAFIADIFRSPALPALQWLGRAVNSAKEAAGDITWLSDARRKAMESAIRHIAALIESSLASTPMALQLKQRIVLWLKELKTAGQNLVESLRIKSIELISQWMSQTQIGQMLTILSGKTFTDLPSGLMNGTNELASATFWLIHGLLQERSASHLSPFPYLHKTPQPLSSPDNTRLAEDQPRMPWQDVHCRIEGPSVYDLSRNFIDRWNGQQAYLADTPPLGDTQVVRTLLETVMHWLNALVKAGGLESYIDTSRPLKLDIGKPNPVWINAPSQLPKPPAPQQGGVSVQVLRSASSRMIQQEQKGRRRAGVELPTPSGIEPDGGQANCKLAMLQAISSAQQFIYIENQFFQSAFGAEGELAQDQQERLSGPMASLRSPSSLKQDLVARVRLQEALDAQNIWQLDWREIDKIAREPGAEARTFLTALKPMWGNNALGWATQKLGQEQSGLLNNIGQALAERIGRAIDEKLPFHVYLVLPVHPEGALNVLNIMHQVHLTMQSLVFGEQSLIKRIQRRMAIRALLDRKVSREDALKIIERKDTSNRPFYEQQDWTRYLTLLNLRTWQTLAGRVVTEQIYIHSKLLIADDRVAILGSANINDRSLQGERDSELAVIVRDSTPITIKLDGVNDAVVGKSVHELRVALWKKHFGLGLGKDSGVKSATDLAQYIDHPAAEKTWKAIQSRATRNADVYNSSFDFIPQNVSPYQQQKTPEVSQAASYKDGFPASIWPTWSYRNFRRRADGGEMLEPMPYEERFWRSTTLKPVKIFRPPIGVQGFITALPIFWTREEHNDSGLNLSMLAQQGNSPQPALADATSHSTQESHRT